MTSSESPALQISSQASRKVFFACILVMLTTTFSPPLLRILGPRAWGALGISEAQWSVALAFRGLILIMFVLFGGVAGDLFGQRRVILLAIWGYLVCSLLAAASPTPTIFIVSNILLAVIGSIIRVLNLTLLLLAFDRRKRVFALMAYSVLYALGFLLSPVFTEQVGRGSGLRWVYVFSILLGAAALMYATKAVPKFGIVRAKVMDILILNIWTGGLCIVIFAVTLAGIVGWSNLLVLSTLAIGTIILIGLRWLERYSFRDERWAYRLDFERQLGVAILSGVVLNLALFSVTTQIFNFFERIQNYNSLIAGFGLLPLLIGAILLSTIAAQLNIKLGMRNALSIGLLTIALASAGFAWLQPELPYWILAILLAVVGFGFIVGNTPRLLLLNASVPHGLVATAQAIGSATAQLGGALAYTVMLTLIRGFGFRVFTGMLQDSGLSTVEIMQQLENLTNVAGGFSLIQAPEIELKVAESLAPKFNLAYTAGLSQAMLVLAIVCVFTAVIVQIVLPRTSRQTTSEV